MEGNVSHRTSNFISVTLQVRGILNEMAVRSVELSKEKGNAMPPITIEPVGWVYCLPEKGSGSFTSWQRRVFSAL